MPTPLARTEGREALRRRARDLADSVFRHRAAEIDRSEAYPWDNVEALTEAGFMGMTLPEAYGGRGRGYLDAVLVIEEVARVCAAAPPRSCARWWPPASSGASCPRPGTASRGSPPRPRTERR